MNTEELKKKIKTLFICRAVLWTIAAGASIYWIVYSFRLYIIGIHEVHEYATILRPILYTCLIISFVSIVVSFSLRRKSDGYKKEMDKEKYKSK